jgi:hypothetical protein
MEWKEEVFSLISGKTHEDIDPAKARLIIIANLPRHIYKYRSVSQHSIENLVNGTVWMSSPSEVNDPFDTVQKINPKDSMAFLIKKDFFSNPNFQPVIELLGVEQCKEALESDEPMKEIVKKSVEADTSIKYESKSEIIDAFEYATQKQYEEFNKWFNERIRDGVKIGSFSEVYDEILMWSHYGKDHSGFCIDWDLSIPQNKLDIGRFLFPVYYVDNIPDTTIYFTPDPEGKELNNLTATISSIQKSKKWAYEKEWRIVFPIGPNTKSYNFQMPKPSYIYLGAKIEEKNEINICSIAKEKRIPVRKMKLQKDRFELGYDEI